MEKPAKPEILPPDPEAIAHMKRAEDPHAEGAEAHASAAETGDSSERIDALRHEIMRSGDGTRGTGAGLEAPRAAEGEANENNAAAGGGGGAGFGKIGKLFMAGWNFFKKVFKAGVFGGLLGFSYATEKIKFGKGGSKGGGGGDSHGASHAKAPAKPAGGGSKGGGHGGGGHGHH